MGIFLITTKINLKAQMSFFKIILFIVFSFFGVFFNFSAFD